VNGAVDGQGNGAGTNKASVAAAGMPTLHELSSFRRIYSLFTTSHALDAGKVRRWRQQACPPSTS
jgi:hypothetical protein